MDNPGPFALTVNGGALQVVSAGVFIGDVISDLAGITAANFQFQLLYGGGGTSVTAYVQTSIDQGQTWADIAAVQFTTASGTEIVNLSGLQAVTTPATPVQQALTPGTCVNG